MAARSFGNYAGINEAIAASSEKWHRAAHLGSEYRQELVLMAVLRAHTIMDRDQIVSYQSVYQLLAFSEPIGLLSQSLIDDGRYKPSLVTSASSAARDAFISSYRTIDWKEFGQIQQFRNSGLAHATEGDLVHNVTYGSLERLVRIECELCHQLNLLHSASAEHIERYLKMLALHPLSFGPQQSKLTQRTN